MTKNHNFQKVQFLSAIDTDKIRRYHNPVTNRNYPSVTSILTILTDEWVKKWREKVGEEVANRISREAQIRGNVIHRLCEYYLRNDVADPDMFHKELFESVVPCLENIDNILLLETPLFSDTIEIAGTPDCISDYEGVPSVIDFKTSTHLKAKDDISHYFMQCAAGAYMFKEQTGIDVKQVVVIVIVEDERKPLIYKEMVSNYIDEFVKTREKFRELHGF